MRPNGIAWRRLKERIAVGLCVLALALALLPLAHIAYTAISIGGQKLNWSFFSQPSAGSPYRGTEGGVLNGIAGTALLLFLGSLLSIPFGVVSGMFLADFGNGRAGAVVRTIADTLLGVPSVIWGLFGFQFIANTVSSFGLHWNTSALSGGLILGLIMSPIIARVTEIALRDVPNGFREASLALGATRWYTTRRLALVVARPAIGTGVLLALTNALGQTVALLFTNGYVPNLPHWPIVGQGNSVTDLGTMIYVYINQPTPLLQPPAEAAVIVLIALVLVLSILARSLSALGGRSHAS